jgi:ankyrin repeat protein
MAVECGNTRAIQILLQAGAQVNISDSSLSTPLHIAAYLGYEEVRLFN